MTVNPELQLNINRSGQGCWPEIDVWINDYAGRPAPKFVSSAVCGGGQAAAGSIRRAGYPDFPKLLLETGFRIGDGSYEFWESTGGAGGQGPERPARDAAPPRMRRNGHPVAAYAWHVAPGGVLVVVDLDRDGWRSVTHDTVGGVYDFAELRPDMLNRVPLIAYRDSMGQWNALGVSSKGTFAGFKPIGAASEAEAVA